MAYRLVMWEEMNHFLRGCGFLFGRWCVIHCCSVFVTRVAVFNCRSGCGLYFSPDSISGDGVFDCSEFGEIGADDKGEVGRSGLFIVQGSVDDIILSAVLNFIASVIV